jgi:hypothetical protein
MILFMLRQDSKFRRPYFQQIIFEKNYERGPVKTVKNASPKNYEWGGGEEHFSPDHTT